MKTRHARTIRNAITAAKTHRNFPYEFVPNYGFRPTQSPLYMRAYDRAGGNESPTVPPKSPSPSMNL